jgi:hypothetical protein
MDKNEREMFTCSTVPLPFENRKSFNIWDEMRQRHYSGKQTFFHFFFSSYTIDLNVI